MALYLLLAITLFNGIYSYFYSEVELLYVAIEMIFYIIIYGIALINFRAKPTSALTITLSAYLLQNIVSVFFGEPSLLFKGIIFKIGFLYFLIKGINEAIKFKKLKRQLEEMGETIHL